MRLKKLGRTALVLVLAFVVFWLCSIAYLQRYVVYDRYGAHINKEWQTVMASDTVRRTSDIVPNVTVLRSIADGGANVRKLSGCYVTLQMLKDVPAVRLAIKNGGYRTVYFQLKDHFGNLYYPSKLTGASVSSVINVNEVAALISDLAAEGCYLIGAIPTMADQKYCLNHIDLGLPLSSGALWVDDDYCYYMDPAKGGTRDYLEAIAIELAGLGFREVVFEDYSFPADTSYVYDESTKTKADVLNETAQVLQEDLGNIINVSFEITLNSGFKTNMSSGRLYFDFSETTSLASAVEYFSPIVLSPELQLVFVNNSHDTRFDDYGHFLPAVNR